MAIDDHSAGPQSPAARRMGEILRRMRCSGACGGRVEAAWLETNARVRPRRVPLRGPEAREWRSQVVASTTVTAGWVLGSPCVLKD